MSFHGLRWYRTAARMIAAGLIFGFAGLGCRHVETREQPKEIREQPKQSEVPRRPQAAPVAADSRLIWEAQMDNAVAALRRKDYSQAELSCNEALKTAGQFGPGRFVPDHQSDFAGSNLSEAK